MIKYGAEVFLFLNDDIDAILKEKRKVDIVIFTKLISDLEKKITTLRSILENFTEELKYEKEN